MAKFKYHQNYEVAFGQFEGAVSLDINKKKTEAVWTFETGAEVTFEGTDLKGNSEELLSAGKITSMTIVDTEQNKALTVTDLNVKATKVMDALFEGGPEGLLFFLTRGNDRVIGNGSEDIVFGGAGDDVLTGKGGPDMFYFQTYDESESRAKAGKETDIITDFDTTGEDADTLYLDEAAQFDYAKANKGEDTLLTFDNGSTLLLEGVKRAEFKAYMEVMFEA